MNFQEGIIVLLLCNFKIQSYTTKLYYSASEDIYSIYSIQQPFRPMLLDKSAFTVFIQNKNYDLSVVKVMLDKHKFDPVLN